jgi:hypothetical protein
MIRLEETSLISTTCTVCGKEFLVEFEIKGEGRHVMLPGSIPPRVRHCAGGNFVDVPGKFTAFYEMVEGQQVKANPLMSDALED